MARGRPSRGPKMAESTGSSEHAQKRLRLILETISGHCSVTDASEALGMSEAAFHKLRSIWLEDAAGLLEPKPTGRPANVLTPDQKRIQELQKELEDAKKNISAAQIQAEVAIGMEHLRLTKEAEMNDAKKNMRKRERRKRRRK